MILKLRTLPTLITLNLFSLFSLSAAPASASITHIHQIEIFQNRIILGTHEGLFGYSTDGKHSKISGATFDVMGLAVSGSKIYASGHPGPGDKRPGLLGLLVSADGGKKWRQVSLLGKVDFHLLEVAGDVILGGDSASGSLFYSDDGGLSWSSRGKNFYTAVALSPRANGAAIAISNGKLFIFKEGFKKGEEISAMNKASNLVWVESGLYITRGNQIMVSQDLGKTWSMKSKFNEDIGSLRGDSQNLIVTIGADIYRSKNGGKSFALLK